MHQNRFVFLLFFLLAMTVGCSENVSLSGRVTFSDDGTPLTHGTVVFDSGSFLARGTINKEGYFNVGSEKATNGIPPGTYKITLTNTDESREVPDRGMPGSMRRISIPVIHQKYSRSTTSGLEITIDKNTKDFSFQVDRAEKRR